MVKKTIPLMHPPPPPFILILLTTKAYISFPLSLYDATHPVWCNPKCDAFNSGICPCGALLYEPSRTFPVQSVGSTTSYKDVQRFFMESTDHSKVRCVLSHASEIRVRTCRVGSFSLGLSLLLHLKIIWFLVPPKAALIRNWIITVIK